MILKVGMRVKGKVTGVQPYGVFLDIGDHKQGLIHISECRAGYVEDINKLFQVGQTVQALIIDIDEYSGKISLSTRSRLVDLNIFNDARPVKLPHMHYWTNYRLDIGFSTIAEYRKNWLDEANNLFR
ncbi:polyribonucleotide nucleotidyltransferase [Lentilactobacillus fungorum]|uniref:Polyribonucleotide nucleotidyltransferase n=1 Tax=Lentilactobacillus fungorum TaxID=2201250 RepID=A0ABQ3W465_9LACO|nr:CvfD/Ygs/GSP13 family RNA-binding post-transcriptional regulator [Lentilactobacillus fungorum]GHP15076.1 polyribonucleotide nucleotidyltransferase [Lentilactobacillus fungorum]